MHMSLEIIFEISMLRMNYCTSKITYVMVREEMIIIAICIGTQIVFLFLAHKMKIITQMHKKQHEKFIFLSIPVK